MKHAEAIRAMLPRAAEAIYGLSADQLNWRPAEGVWSVAECIDHLNVTNIQYANSIENALANAS